jgi:hypothetical protein
MTTWDYILDLFRPHDRVVICWKLHTAAAFNQRFLTAQQACQDPFQRFLRAMNSQGNNIYIGMNPIRPGATTRTKKDIAEVRRIYLDLDHDGDTSLQGILNSTIVPQPNYVLNTSPAKYQVIWNVKDFQSDPAEALMRHLAREFRADPGTIDVSRVFRLPGLHNKKYEATFRVTVRKLTSTLYTPAQFPAPASVPAPTPQKSSHPGTKQRHSRSEIDWAYCCHALWPDPASTAVIAHLTDEMERRAQGRRAKPRYYAELTVSKAADYIASKKRDSSGGSE